MKEGNIYLTTHCLEREIAQWDLRLYWQDNKPAVATTWATLSD